MAAPARQQMISSAIGSPVEVNQDQEQAHMHRKAAAMRRLGPMSQKTEKGAFFPLPVAPQAPTGPRETA
jgi:hypothetical protein